MKPYGIIIVILLLFWACIDIPEEEPASAIVDNPGAAVQLNESMVVTVFASPRGADKALNGTGVVVDKENGLILTALHGVYRGKVNDYKRENLCQNIRVVDQDKNGMDAYVVHLSPDEDDLALLKVDHRFETQAIFAPSKPLKVKDKLDFWGYPGGSFRTLSGAISRTSIDYLDLDMTVKGGMSGGPVFIPGKGIVGIVVLEQVVGGTALRSEVVVDYLKYALPKARQAKKIAASFCLEKIILTQPNMQYIRKNKFKLIIRIKVNGNKIFETKGFSVAAKEISWHHCEAGHFQLSIIPGDKIEINLMEDTLLPIDVSKNIPFTRKPFNEYLTFEKVPQVGVLNLESGVAINGNRIIFKRKN
jgi:hypothetical protein